MILLRDGEEKRSVWIAREGFGQEESEMIGRNHVWKISITKFCVFLFLFEIESLKPARQSKKTKFRVCVFKTFRKVFGELFRV